MTDFADLTDEQRRVLWAQVAKVERDRTTHYTDESVTLHHGDCLDVLRTLEADSVDAVVTDPPYGLEFMGKGWDGADGFRRSLNPADAGRDNVFGRTSRTGPEYRTGHSIEPFRSNDGYDRLAQPVRRGAPVESAPLYQQWCEAWSRECLRVLKPGGHLLAFGGTRTAHRLACAIEDAGFELRDTIAWLYGSGFPKSLDVSKAIDKAAGAEREVVGPRTRVDGKAPGRVSHGLLHEGRENRGVLPAVVTAAATEEAERWQGWGTALKPAFEPIIVARKSLTGTVATNVLAHGTGALNIDGCRTEAGADYFATAGDIQGGHHRHDVGLTATTPSLRTFRPGAGRWPTNVVLDPAVAAELDAQTGTLTSGANPTRRGSDKVRDAYGDFKGQESCDPARGANSGGASRFFPVFRYEAKAPTDERPRFGDTAHPTVKPLDLMRWLVRLVTPPGGLVLEPFAGSGTTAEACIVEGFRCVAIEREADYLPLILARITKPIQPDMFGASA